MVSPERGKEHCVPTSATSRFSHVERASSTRPDLGGSTGRGRIAIRRKSRPEIETEDVTSPNHESELAHAGDLVKVIDHSTFRGDHNITQTRSVL
ncbi:hypothetical protein BHM03_00036346 [Ensete ventricosum]|nr:hypothetical protein BHM03_00036346 [Ensete ventricosum]